MKWSRTPRPRTERSWQEDFDGTKFEATINEQYYRLKGYLVEIKQNGMLGRGKKQQCQIIPYKGVPGQCIAGHSGGQSVERTPDGQWLDSGH